MLRRCWLGSYVPRAESCLGLLHSISPAVQQSAHVVEGRHATARGRKWDVVSLATMRHTFVLCRVAQDRWGGCGSSLNQGVRLLLAPESPTGMQCYLRDLLLTFW
jgi:hypothetical protein